MRTYHELPDPDRSKVATQVAEQRDRVARRLASVRHVVAVASGKGGVGKSFVAAGLARALRRRGAAVGLLDADLGGPTVARLTQAERPELAVVGAAVTPAMTADGVLVFSGEYLAAPGEPVRWRAPRGDDFVWRGALEAGLLREMLADVAWGALDVLLIDLPPGAARLADVHDLVPGVEVLAVTIPSAESFDAVHRALTLARERGLSLLGIIENMSSHRCPQCGDGSHPYPGDAGDRIAEAFDLPLLARVPFAPEQSQLDALASAVSGQLQRS